MNYLKNIINNFGQTKMIKLNIILIMLQNKYLLKITLIIKIIIINNSN